MNSKLLLDETHIYNSSSSSSLHFFKHNFPIYIALYDRKKRSAMISKITFSPPDIEARAEELFDTFAEKTFRCSDSLMKYLPSGIG